MAFQRIPYRSTARLASNHFRKTAVRSLSSTSTRASRNRIYNPVRNAEEFNNLLLLSSSSRQALITLWTASWCRTCRSVAPLLEEVMSLDDWKNPDGTPIDGQPLQPVSYAEVEMDAPDMTEVVGRYQVRSIPMLLSFSRGEPQMTTAVTDARKLTDRQFLLQWLAVEARRAGQGGAGGSLFGGLFG